MTSIEIPMTSGRSALGAGLQRLKRRAPLVPLEPEVASPAQAQAALARFADGLSDESWRVSMEDGALFATKHPGLRYRMASLIDRFTRGELAVWRDGDALRVEFRPDWPRIVLDLVFIAALYRWFSEPFRGNLGVEVGIFTVLFLLVYACALPFLRARFLLILCRAVWLDDDQWESARDWADKRRFWFAWARRGALAWLGWNWWQRLGAGAWFTAHMFWSQQPLIATLYAASVALSLVVAAL